MIDYDLAEVAVLAASMRDESGRSSATALEHLTPEDFSTPERKRIFTVLSKLAPKCNEADIMTCNGSDVRGPGYAVSWDVTDENNARKVRRLVR